MIKVGTQNQAFLPEDLLEKFKLLQKVGFDSYEIDGKYLVDNLELVKAVMKETNFPVTSACGGYSGWIGDFDDSKRLNGISEIKAILDALASINAKGLVLPAAWGMFTFRLPPHVAQRTHEEDIATIHKSLKELDLHAQKTKTIIYLEPLNRYQDHMLNLTSDAATIINDGQYTNVKILADFYHMSIEEDNMPETIEKYGDLIKEYHVAENHRYQAGSGSLDFKSIIDAIKKTNYDGYLIFEGRVRGDDLLAEYQKALDYTKSFI